MGCFQTGLTGRSADVTVEPVTRSLRWDGDNNSNLYRATGSTDTTWTVAMWVKRSALGSLQYLFSWGGDGLNFDANDKISIWNGSSYATSTAVFRDTSSWYHLTVSCSSGAITVYVNGTAQTMSSSPSYPAWGNLYFGRWSGNTLYDFNGYLADVFGIEGEAKSPTDFIELGDYGNYIPKNYTGTFGHNGFHLDNQPKNSADLLIQSSHNESSTVFSDSANGIAVTKHGDARHSIFRASPLASDERSMYFDGVNDYIKVGSGSSDFAFGTGDYTIEGWFMFSSLTGVRTLCDLRPFNSVDNNRTFFGTTGSGLYMYLGGSNTTLAASGSLTTHRWHHIAFVRSSGTLKTYINGELKTSITSSTNHSTDGTPHLGSTPRFNIYYNVNHEAFLQGYVYDFRIINGTAAYTGEFTPPSGKLTATGGSYPSTTNVNTSITSSHTQLLIQPDKNDSSINDETSNQGLTVTGTVIPSSGPYEQDTTASSIFFDGGGDFLQTGTSSDLTFGTGSFTVELWCMPYQSSTSGSYKGIISDELYSTEGGWAVTQKDDELSLWIKDTGGSWVSFVASSALTAYEWHHIAVSYNSSDTTTRLFVDGAVVASGTTSGWNLTGDQVEVGRSTSSAFFNGHAYDVRVTKGSALYTAAFDTPTAPFELEPTFIGADQSGNRFHFTPTNISMHDVVPDTPTKNYATLNPVGYIDEGTDPTFSEGNLKITGGQADNKIPSTIAVSSGKWYAEVRVNAAANMMMGVAKTSAFTVDGYYLGQSGTDDSWMIYRSNGNEYHNGSGSKISGGLTTGDILQIALDLDNNKLWWGKNDTWVGTVGTSGETTITAGEYYFAHGYSGGTATWNFGQDNTFGGLFTGTPNNAEFAYEIPTGFKSLNTSNLDAPSVTPSEHFNTVLYTGTRDNSSSLGATSNAVTGMGFSAELLWIKDRDNQSNNYGSGYLGHFLFDSVQGTGRAINIDGNMYTGNNDFSTNLDGYDGVSSFTSPTGGFTLDESEAVNYAYDSDYSGSIDTYERYVAWGWKLGSNGGDSTWAAGNTDPTTEKYNASAGVSVIRQEETSGTYPMAGVTVNHSLGAAPEFVFLMDNTSNTQDIFAWHKDLDANKYLKLNQSSAQTTGSGYFPAGCSTATTFEIGGDIAGANSSGGWWDIYAYLFTGVEGYSKFGSYTGTGSATSPPFIYTGFEVGWLLSKNIDSGTVHWNLHDAARNPHNVVDERVWPNLPNAKDSNYDKFDFLSNGFRPVTGDAGHNGNGNTIIYAAFSSSSPFKHANAR